MEVSLVYLGPRNLTEVFVAKLILKKGFVNVKMNWIPPAAKCFRGFNGLIYFMSLAFSVPAENVRKPKSFWCFQGV